MTSHILEVAIGMAYVYLIFSLICTVVNEGISSILTMRAKNLEAGIKSLFSEDVPAGGGAANGKSFTQQIYEHPLVRGLYRDAVSAAPAQQAKRAFFSRVKLPSYIPSRIFSRALLDSIAPATTTETRAGLDQMRALLQNLPDGIAKKTLLDLIPSATTTQTLSFGQVVAFLQNLPDSTTKKALLSLTINTQGDMEKFQRNVEDWFNDSMDRASGWYKRQTHNILLVVAFAVTLVANVDSVRMMKSLWTDPALEQATADAAKNWVARHQAAADATASKDAGANALKDTMSGLYSSLPANLPIGWKKEDWQPAGTSGDKALFWGGKALGWVFTALALSLGAPFWFDLLNKFMVIRSTVKPQEKSRIEGSKDKT